jgi:hypothetical protein
MIEGVFDQLTGRRLALVLFAAGAFVIANVYFCDPPHTKAKSPTAGVRQGHAWLGSTNQPCGAVSQLTQQKPGNRPARMPACAGITSDRSSLKRSCSMWQRQTAKQR